MDRAAWYEWTWLFVTDPEEVRRRVKRDPKLLEVRGLWGETPMMFLAIEAQTQAVLLALELGADADFKDEFGRSALQSCMAISAHQDCGTIIAALLRHGANPHHFTEVHACAWHQAQSSHVPLAVRELFAGISPPSSHHKHCEREVLGKFPDDE